MLIYQYLSIIVSIFFMLTSMSCHVKREIVYPESWPYSELTVPPNAVPISLGPAYDNKEVFANLIQEKDDPNETISWGIGFHCTDGWEYVKSHFADCIASLPVSEDIGPSTSVSIYITVDRKTRFALYRWDNDYMYCIARYKNPR